MTLFWALLAAVAGLVLGFQGGRWLVTRRERQERDALAARLAAAQEEHDGALAERQAELARRQAENEELARRLVATEDEARRTRRWAETQFRGLLAEMQQAWSQAGLPDRLDEERPEVPAELQPRLDALAGRLQRWMDELSLASPELCYQLGLWHALAGRLKEGSELFQEAVQRGMGVEAWLALGDCLWELDRSERARSAYRNTLGMRNTPLRAALRTAQVEVQKYQFKECVATLERVMGNGSVLPAEAYALASYAHGKLGQDREAVAACETGLKRHRGNAELHAKMIIPLYRMGEVDRAETAYLKALELDEQCAEAHFAMGVAQMQQGDEKAAARYFRQALELQKSYPQAHCCIGLIHNRAGQYKKALQHLKKAVDMEPGYAAAWYAMKDAYEGLKDFDQAVAALRRATTLNPDYR